MNISPSSTLDVCCWSNCGNPAGGGTHTMIDVPQVGAEPMRVTLPVCEEHWYGNWVRQDNEAQTELALLRQRLSQIAALASGEKDAPAVEG